MSDFEVTTPLLSDDITAISDAMQLGIADELPFWGLIKGYDINVFPEGADNDGVPYIKIEHLGGKSLVEYQLAPPPEVINPMVVIEPNESGDIIARAVMGRMVVTSSAYLMKIGVRDGIPISTNQIQVDVLDREAVMTVNESLGINPVHGEYDDTAYRFIRNKAYEELRLGYVAQFARQYLAA